MKKSRKKLLLISASVAVLIGIYLAKETPLNERHGLSVIYNHKEAEETKESKEKKEKVVKKEDPEVTYLNTVNKEIENGSFSGRLTVPLLLQTDEKWKSTPYGIGSEEENTLEINGCAILSLAMVSSFLDKKTVLPSEVLEWSGNNYFLENEGTTWAIFPEYAEMKGYSSEELGIDFPLVEEHIKQGHPVIISVKPGYFTTTGHVMVITGMEDGKFWLNDPNDSKEKNHSNQLYSVEQLENEALNFWSIYK